jgi:hypothetical protein
MVATLPSPTTDGDAEVKINVYCSALSDLPAWAVIEACGSALRGKLGSYGGRYLPSPGELHQAAERYLESVFREKAEIGKILSARVEEDRSQEDRAAAVERMGKVVAKTLNTLRGARPRNELAKYGVDGALIQEGEKPLSQVTQQEVQANLARIKETMPTKITLSDELFAMTGGRRPPLSNESTDEDVREALR